MFVRVPRKLTLTSGKDLTIEGHFPLKELLLPTKETSLELNVDPLGNCSSMNSPLPHRIGNTSQK